MKGLNPAKMTAIVLVSFPFAIAGTGGEYDSRIVDNHGLAVTSQTGVWSYRTVGMALTGGGEVRIPIKSATQSSAQIVEAEANHVKIMIRQSREFLGLNISQLARVLGVERPTVYSWLEGRLPHRGNNLAKLEKLHERAEMWHAIAPRPGLILQSQSSGYRGKSLLEWLDVSGSRVDDESFIEAIRLIAKNVAAREERWAKELVRSEPGEGDDMLRQVLPRIG